MWFKKKIIPEKIKSRNTKELRSKGIDVIEHLPYLDMPDFRDPKKIAQRMMVLLALYQLHVEAPLKVIIKWIDSNGLNECMTDEEKEFLKTDYKNLPKQSQIDIYWFIEALWAFAWIGGLHNSLSFNKDVEDTLASMLPDIANDETSKLFVEEFKLRKEFEIFNMLDKFYRAHWFAKNNNLTGVSSNKANLDLIMERRKALEFTCNSQIDWDEISLDT